MNKLILAMVAMLGVALTASDSLAAGSSNPFQQRVGITGKFFFKHPMPAFQAAPWYLYWPYSAHFMTPAPLQGQYFAPPPGGGMVNPYFPGMQYTPAP